MKDASLLLIGNLVSISCVFSALWLCHKGRRGWGWFLFAAIVCAATIHIS